MGDPCAHVHLMGMQNYCIKLTIIWNGLISWVGDAFHLEILHYCDEGYHDHLSTSANGGPGPGLENVSKC